VFDGLTRTAPQAFSRLSAERLRSTMWRDDDSSMVAAFSRIVSVREIGGFGRGGVDDPEPGVLLRPHRGFPAT
jgi:hypothetical protein